MKLYQNRIVIVGRTYRDAHKALGLPHIGLEFDGEEKPVIIATEAHRLTISGMLGGMHVAEAFFTWDSPAGPSYEHARELLERITARSHGKLWTLDVDGHRHPVVKAA